MKASDFRRKLQNISIHIEREKQPRQRLLEPNIDAIMNEVWPEVDKEFKKIGKERFNSGLKKAEDILTDMVTTTGRSCLEYNKQTAKRFNNAIKKIKEEKII